MYNFNYARLLLKPTPEVPGKVAQHGGVVAFCDQCPEHYCLDCSEKVGKPIIRHRGQTCEQREEDARRLEEIENLTTQHRNRITDAILTLRCPRCKQAFIDFENCFAITCSKCKCEFCGYCLQDCGDDAHAHVVKCPLNEKGGLFNTEEAFIATQSKRNTACVIEYLKAIEDGNLRAQVYNAVERDLRDVHIQLTLDTIGLPV